MNRLGERILLFFSSDAFLSACEYVSRNNAIILFALFSSLSVFFLVSRRMNARLEPSSPVRLPGPNDKAKEQLAASQPQSDMLAAIRGTKQWLAERRMSILLLLFASWLVVHGFKWLNGSTLVESFNVARENGDAAHMIWFALAIAMCGIFSALFFIAHANREFYIDVIALFILLYTAMYKLFNCWTFGSCFGIPWPWGVYNEVLDTTVFPVQLFEFGLGMILSILCILYMLYGKSYKPGRGCFFCMLSFTVPRFFWDFLRYYGEEYRPLETVVLGLTPGQIVCMIGVLISVAWLLVLPLEKKLMDRFWAFAARRLHRH